MPAAPDHACPGRLRFPDQAGFTAGTSIHIPGTPSMPRSFVPRHVRMASAWRTPYCAGQGMQDLHGLSGSAWLSPLDCMAHLHGTSARHLLGMLPNAPCTASQKADVRHARIEGLESCFQAWHSTEAHAPCTHGACGKHLRRAHLRVEQDSQRMAKAKHVPHANGLRTGHRYVLRGI